MSLDVGLGSTQVCSMGLSHIKDTQTYLRSDVLRGLGSRVVLAPGIAQCSHSCKEGAVAVKRNPK